MLIKLKTEDLTFGVYVSKLDRPWIETSFLFQGFIIRTSDELKQLESTCEFVFVDEEKSKAETPTRSSPSLIQLKQKSTDRSTPVSDEDVYHDFKEELSVATGIHSSASNYIKTMLEDTRMGSTIDTVTTVSGTLVSNNANASPVSQAIVFLRNVTTSTDDDLGTISSVNGTVDQSVSNPDGSFTLYATTPGTYVLYTRMDSDINYGSGVYNGTAIKQIAQGDATAKIIYFADLTTPFTAPANIAVPTLGDADGGVGYLDGNTDAGSTGVSIRIDGISGASGLFNMTGSRSRGDGSFKVTLPAGTYDRIRSGGGNCDTVSIGNGATTTLTFDGTGTPPC